ncbi:MAG: hypothetical protein DYG99_13315 [Bacteroidetes bacterium CHB5]|nr:hypothetical protein [Bacteroidetes bacterium CHB5]
MKLFLQIELIQWREAGYQKPMLNYASSLSDDLIGAELDNQSDGSIADLVIRLCDQVESVFVLVRANPDEPPGVTLKLIQHLLRKEEKIYKVVLAGNHVSLERMLLVLNERFVRENDPEKIKPAIQAFAQLKPDK